jgi:hypothetical protein
LTDSGMPADLVEVRLLELSLADYAHSAAHHDELFREFALILSCEPATDHEVPRRLTAVMEELTERFRGFTAAPQGQLQAALERGDEAIDLTFRVPAAAREAALRLHDLLAAADEYCRQGELLTVAPPPDAVRFRNWYLHEFVAQIDGEPPTPWPARRGGSAGTS